MLPTFTASLLNPLTLEVEAADGRTFFERDVIDARPVEGGAYYKVTRHAACEGVGTFKVESWYAGAVSARAV
jgi:hypothetical protein